jgi:hypothetical protein
MRTSLRSSLRSWVRRLGRPSSVAAKSLVQAERGVFGGMRSPRASHQARFHHRPARSVLGAGIRLTGSRLLVRSPAVLRAGVCGVRKARLLGCARSGVRLVCTQLPPPNYSIERTRPGEPGRASHVKR